VVWMPLDTIIETAYRRVCPLYSFDDRNRVYLRGSAVPFATGGLRFLITAAHTCVIDQKPVPLFVYGRERPHALTQRRGAWQYRPGVDTDLDVAVIALDDEAADDLQLYHWFCTPADVSVVVPKTPGMHYLIAGYPVSRNRIRPLRYGLPSRATGLITGEIVSVKTSRAVDKGDENHFALAFPHEKVPRAGGGDFHVPPPYGMSGGGVWRLEIDTVRRFAKTPSLVGIGIEYHKAQKVFVATRIQTVAPLALDLADPNTPTSRA
jgi:hypothetical protein